MKEQQDLYDELQEQAPFLAPLKKKGDGLRVPEGYFDNLEADVFRQLDALGARPNPAAFPAHRRDTSWWQALQRLWQPRLALAFAGVLALALAAWWTFGPAPAAPQPDLAAALSAEDMEAYLLDNLLELEPEQIALALPAEEWPPILVDQPGHTAPAAGQHEIQISPGELENLLRDMSDEELEELL